MFWIFREIRSNTQFYNSWLDAAFGWKHKARLGRCKVKTGHTSCKHKQVVNIGARCKLKLTTAAAGRRPIGKQRHSSCKIKTRYRRCSSCNPSNAVELVSSVRAVFLVVTNFGKWNAWPGTGITRKLRLRTYLVTWRLSAEFENLIDAVF